MCVWCVIELMYVILVFFVMLVLISVCWIVFGIKLDLNGVCVVMCVGIVLNSVLRVVLE